MTRLVIDARLAGHSGIGTYLEQLLPRVVDALGRERPRVLVRATEHARLRAQLGLRADIETWDVAPLSIADLWARPPGLDAADLLWTPHFNVPLRSRCALAVTLHDLLPLTAPGLAGRFRAQPVRLWLRATARRARVVFCVSEFTRGEALRHSMIDPAKTCVTPLGVDAAWFATTPGASQRRADVPTIIFTGVLKPHKNVARLLRAFAQVSTRIPHRLTLVARRRGLRNLDRDALALLKDAGARVDVVDDLPIAALIERVRQAEFAVLPSLHEGFGLPALEAMAAGTPLLASRAGALPEVCGEAALYCDPESVDDIARGLLRLAQDPALRQRLRAAGRARAETFSWDACAATTTARLAQALADLRAVPR